MAIRVTCNGAALFVRICFKHFSARQGSFPKYDLLFAEPKVMFSVTGIGDAMNVVSLCLDCDGFIVGVGELPWLGSCNK
jgi:hypothetical protein